MSPVHPRMLTDVLLLFLTVMMLMMMMMMVMICTGTNADADCSTDNDLQVSSGEVASCVHALHGCCPDGKTARQTDDDDSCVTPTSNAWPTSPRSSATANVTSIFTSPSQTTVVVTTVAMETPSRTVAMDATSTNAVMETTTRVVSSSDHVSLKDDSEEPVTSSGTDREPAYNTMMSPTDDVTTLMMAQPTPDDDTRRRGA